MEFVPVLHPWHWWKSSAISARRSPTCGIVDSTRSRPTPRLSASALPRRR